MASIRPRKPGGPLYLWDRYQIIKDGKKVWRTWRESLGRADINKETQGELIRDYEDIKLREKRGLPVLRQKGGADEWDAFTKRYIKDIKRNPLTRQKEMVVIGHFNKIIKPIRMSEIKREHAERFIQIRLSHGTMASTVKTDSSYLRSIFDQAVMWDCIPKNPFYKLKVPGGSVTKLPKAWTEDEVKMILAKIFEREGEFWFMLFNVLYFAGLRIDELRHVKKEYIYFNREMIFLDKTKGGKEAEVEILPDLKPLLEKYVPRGAKGYLCVWPETGKQIHANTIQNKIGCATADLVKAGKLDERWLLPRVGTPHTFRHSIASHLLALGYTLAEVRDHLRHENIATTNRYTHVLNGKSKFGAFRLATSAAPQAATA